MPHTTADDWFHVFREARHLPRWMEARARPAAEAPPHGRDRHRDRGAAGFGFGFGPMGQGGPGGAGFGFGRFPFGRGPRARRGDVRAAALVLLAEAPRNGYQLMQEIEQRSRGLWRPSPGSMYPVLQQLEDEGLVRPDGPDGRRVFALTAEGTAYVTEHAAELGTPWDAVAGSAGDDRADYWSLVAQVAMAARQVMHAGSRRQAEAAQEVLVDARRRLYRILAEEEAPEDDAPRGDAPR